MKRKGDTKTRLVQEGGQDFKEHWATHRLPYHPRSRHYWALPNKKTAHATKAI